MLRTFSLELTSLVNSDPAWKVPKGSRSASRRAKKIVCASLKNCTVVINRSSESSTMPVSGSEKHGASMLDCRFGEKAEHVPLKKRRFLFRASPSPPPPVVASQGAEETGSHANKQADVESAASDINLSKIIDDTVTHKDKNSEDVNKSFGEGEDFCGISILAAAACSSSLGGDSSDTKDGLGVKESSAQGQDNEISPVADTPLSTSTILGKDLSDFSHMPTGGTSSCVGTEPVGKFGSVSTTVNPSQNVTSGKGAEDTSVKVDPLTLSCDVSCSRDEERAGIQKQGFRDDRFHWDLNVVMDAWEQPFESPAEQNNFCCNRSQDVGKSSPDDSMEKLKVHDLQFKLETACAAQDFQVPREHRTLAEQSFEENKLTLDISSCGHVVQPTNLDEKPLLSDYNKNLVIMSEDSKLLSNKRTSKSTDGCFDPALDPELASGTINDSGDASVQSLKLNVGDHPMGKLKDDCLRLSTGGSCSMLEDVKRSCASDDAQPSLCISSSSDISMEVKPDLATLGRMKTSQELWHNRSFIAETGGFKTVPAPEQLPVTSDGNKVSHSSTSVEAPNSSSTKCEVLAALDVKKQDFGNDMGEILVCADETTVKISESSSLSKETCEASPDSCIANLNKSSNCFGKVGAAKAFNHSDGNVCCHPPSVVGSTATVELQEACDSQYEDGEVREPNELPWEGYDALDREVEHVDYESDEMGACTINQAGYLVSESSQVEDRENCGPRETAIITSSVCGVNKEDGGEAAKTAEDYVPHEEENKVKLNPQFEEEMNESLSKELLGGRANSSDMDIGVSDDEGGKDRLASHADGLVGSKCGEIRIESRPFRRGLQSRIEGLVAHDASQEERLNRMESRFEESSSIRSSERTRYPFHNQARGRPADSWDGFSDNHRTFRRHYSPHMHRHSRLDDAANAERDDIGYGVVQDDVSYSVQLLPKGRLGGNEDDCGRLHSRCRPNRTFSPGRPGTFGRGRSFRHGAFVENRGGRGRYSGPSPDDSFQSSLKFRRPLFCRERSFSPSGGRGHPNAHHSRGKSPSQSRSRSPIMWNSPRGRSGTGNGRNNFVRHRSRSPDFGSDLGMQRPRSAHQQPGFRPDDAVGFRSNSRNHGSPVHGRWNSTGKEDIGHFREFGYKQRAGGFERSPGRIRVRGDRAGVYDPPRNLKPDDGYYRISEDVSSRGPRLEENYDGRRKQYGPPARHSYEDNMAGRLHQDINDGFSLPRRIRDRDVSNYRSRGLRGMDNHISDEPRRFMGEQHSFMCEDGRSNSTSKQFGGDVVDSSRNLKSEEHFQLSHAGRFDNMDGINQGRRYDYYDNRRKQYDPPNRIKRGDADGSERRLNHNLDENFRDASEFCGRPMKSFDGRVGSFSTRLREDRELAGRGPENKLEDNPHTCYSGKDDSRIESMRNFGEAPH